jgi:hypothetical protein
VSRSACSKRCCGLRIATFPELFRGGVLDDRKALFASLQQPLAYLNESVQCGITIDLCDPAGFITIVIRKASWPSESTAGPLKIELKFAVDSVVVATSCAI